MANCTITEKLSYGRAEFHPGPPVPEVPIGDGLEYGVLRLVPVCAVHGEASAYGDDGLFAQAATRCGVQRLSHTPPNQDRKWAVLTVITGKITAGQSGSPLAPSGDSNARTRLRRPMLYPLSYEGRTYDHSAGHPDSLWPLPAQAGVEEAVGVGFLLVVVAAEEAEVDVGGGAALGVGLGVVDLESGSAVAVFDRAGEVVADPEGVFDGGGDVSSVADRGLDVGAVVEQADEEGVVEDLLDHGDRDGDGSEAGGVFAAFFVFGVTPEQGVAVDDRR